MASPPYRSPATSPPGPAHAALPNPRKRPGSMGGSGTLNKRRKPSSFSAASHPLRQTSFPPEEALAGAGERSPSVDSDYTAVTGNQSVAASQIGSKKRARKKKDGTESVISGGGKGGADARSKTGALDEDGEEDDDDEEGGAGMVDEGEQGKVDKLAEKKKIAVLMDAFNEDQNERYNTYRRVKLKKETIRKIVNQTLSQSVPPSVITTINGFTKVFVGTLIERAREVQQQEQHAARSLPTPPRTQETMTDPSTSMSSTLQGTQTSGGSHAPPFKDRYIGPLLPDHIREAYRRYRKDGEGGGAGVSGLSVGLGVPGTGVARAGGKRLFK